MTLTGSIMGTAQYLSPEQAQGQPVSAASDIYAIGIVLYELLTGVVPFDGETAVASRSSRSPPSRARRAPSTRRCRPRSTRSSCARSPRTRRTLRRRRRVHRRARSRAADGLPGPGAAVGRCPGAESDGYGKARERRLPLEARRRRAPKRPRSAVAVVGAALRSSLALAVALRAAPTGRGRVTVPNVIGQTEQAAPRQTAGSRPHTVPSARSQLHRADGVGDQQTPDCGSVRRNGAR